MEQRGDTSWRLLPTTAAAGSCSLRPESQEEKQEACHLSIYPSIRLSVRAADNLLIEEL